jgi:hypothetical protein
MLLAKGQTQSRRNKELKLLVDAGTNGRYYNILPAKGQTANGTKVTPGEKCGIIRSPARKG